MTHSLNKTISVNCPWTKNIYLTGFMGAGKTTVGFFLAKNLGLPFEDMDRLIEEKEKRTISDIFQNHGESYFRLKEKEVLQVVGVQVPSVVALGGGTILAKENRDFLLNTGWVIYLRTRIETLTNRISQDRCRGQNLRPLAHLDLERLFLERKPYYEMGIAIDTDEKSPGQIAQEISASLFERGMS